MSLPFFNSSIISGSTAHNLGGCGGGCLPVGGWVELGRTTLGGTATTIDVSSLADKRYYMFLMDYDLNNSVSQDNTLRLGNSTVDTCSNYALRDSSNGCTDVTNISTDFIRGDGAVGAATGDQGFRVGYIANRSANEKLIQHWNVTRSGAGETNAPDRYEVTAKWVNTSNPLDVIRLGYGGNTYETGSEVVVLGWDESDTHTNNFWEELASVELGGDTSTIDSGVFTAKKYLWVQFYAERSATADARLRVGNSTVDTGSNYAGRTSSNGGSDTTDASQSAVQNIIDSGNDIPNFGNMFIINNASNEKLMILHKVAQNTAGAATAPTRRESVWKWTNTSNQIDRIELSLSTGNYRSGGIMKVWGAD